MTCGFSSHVGFRLIRIRSLSRGGFGNVEAEFGQARYDVVRGNLEYLAEYVRVVLRRGQRAHPGFRYQQAAREVFDLVARRRPRNVQPVMARGLAVADSAIQQSRLGHAWSIAIQPVPDGRA